MTYATATILNAVSNGYSYGFDIVDITGMPGGTVYPALQTARGSRLPDLEVGEGARGAGGASPRRKYYELTRAGREALADAIKRYRLLEQTQLSRMRAPKSSRA